MMSGVPQHLRKKYIFKHVPSLDLLPHHDPLNHQRHLNHTSPLPTSRRGLRGIQVPIPSSRMKGLFIVIIFDIEVLYMIPWCLSISKANLLNFWSMVDFIFELDLGFFYIWYTNSLNWE